MKTFKVTFFTKDFEISSIETFHSVTNQHSLIEVVSNQIVVNDLLPFVKCSGCDINSSKDIDYTKAMNRCIKSEIGNSYYIKFINQF